MKKKTTNLLLCCGLLWAGMVMAQTDQQNDGFSLRINAGGMATTYDHNDFVADTYYDTGHTLDRPQTGLPEPYQTFRFSRSQVMGYDIPLEDGEYTVNLHFAELWFGATGGGSGGVGSRVFDVSLEGQLAEDNLDIYAEVGAEMMLVKTHTVTVTDGVLNIDFDSRDEVGGKRHPVINAIEILGEIVEPEQRPFVTTWKTNNTGDSDDNQITIPTDQDEAYDYTVDWGDGTTSENVMGNITHTYAVPGTYEVSISGTFPAIKFGSFGLGDRRKIIEINQWGNIMWSSFENAFIGCTNMVVLSTDYPNLSKVKSLSKAFLRCSSLTNNGHFEGWDVSNIEDMSELFSETPFNQDIGGWDVGQVKSMRGMFYYTPFNQDIGSWNTVNVVSINQMFYNTPFNHDIGNWDVSNVLFMEQVFQSTPFNQDIGDWDVGNVVRFHSMFQRTPFNQDIGDWDVGNAEDMSYMFDGAGSFNQDISDWDVGNVKYMQGMFREAISFNQDLSGWNTENLIIAQRMFKRAISFDQDLGSWNIENVTVLEGMFTGITLSNENYDSILDGWSNQSVHSSMEFDGGDSQYCESLEARQRLIGTMGWIILDGGRTTDCDIDVPDIDFALRFNAGGEQVEYKGDVFLKDNNYTGGQTLKRPQTGLPEPYQTLRFNRYQVMGYDIPLENGEYTVKLHFAELWFGATGGGSGGVGSRVFDVSLEGQLAEDNLDIFAEVGADAMLVKTHTVTVTDGVLNIDFDARDEVGGERHPVINAIEILGSDGNSGKGYVVKGAQDNQMDLYPNQADTYVQAEFDTPVRAQRIMVFDMAGRLVRSYVPENVEMGAGYRLDVSGYGAGTYILNIVDDTGAIHQEQVVVKH